MSSLQAGQALCDLVVGFSLLSQHAVPLDRCLQDCCVAGGPSNRDPTFCQVSRALPGSDKSGSLIVQDKRTKCQDCYASACVLISHLARDLFWNVLVASRSERSESRCLNSDVRSVRTPKRLPRWGDVTIIKPESLEGGGGEATVRCRAQIVLHAQTGLAQI